MWCHCLRHIQLFHSVLVSICHLIWILLQVWVFQSNSMRRWSWHFSGAKMAFWRFAHDSNIAIVLVEFNCHELFLYNEHWMEFMNVCFDILNAFFYKLKAFFKWTISLFASLGLNWHYIFVIYSFYLLLSKYLNSIKIHVSCRSIGIVILW